MKKIRIFRCNICGSIVAILDGNTNTLTCCGEKMEELHPSFEDTLKEKHVPVISKFSNYVKVTVGEVLHPMMENHYIEWILIKTNFGIKINYLNSLNKPFTEFTLSPNERIEEAYCYCNIHGLWATKVESKSCSHCD